MIVVDSSALIAILDLEDDALRYADALQNADRLLISAVNVHETGVVLRIRRANPSSLYCGGFFWNRTILRSSRSTRLKRLRRSSRFTGTAKEFIRRHA